MFQLKYNLISFGNFGLVEIKIYNNHSHNVSVVDMFAKCKMFAPRCREKIAANNF